MQDSCIELPMIVLVYAAGHWYSIIIYHHHCTTVKERALVELPQRKVAHIILMTTVKTGHLLYLHLDEFSEALLIPLCKVMSPAYSMSEERIMVGSIPDIPFSTRSNWYKTLHGAPALPLVCRHD